MGVLVTSTGFFLMKTKPILLFSLLLNVIALALGGVLAYHGHDQVSPATEVKRAAITEIPRQKESASPAATVPEPRPLHWSDLLSTDDATYARNLRTIGCPEETIRDILTAAIAHRYDAQRQDIVVQHQQGRIDTAAMQAAVAQLWEQQNEAVNQVPRPAVTSAATQSTEVAPSASAPAAGPRVGNGAPAGTAPRDSAIRMPIALKEPDASLGLNEAQRAAVDQVGDHFAQAINAPKLAPTDPAYHQLWKDAQSDADERLKVQIGWEAYLQMELRNSGQK